MIHVVGHWEIGYMTPIMEHYYWAFVLRDFEVKHWWMNPVSGIRNTEERLVKLRERHSYDEIFEDLDKNLLRVFIEPRTKHHNPNTTWLHDFEHPRDCVYIFGSAHYNPTLNYKRAQDMVVSIKTIKDVGGLWSNQCLAMVLYDRMIKWD